MLDTPGFNEAVGEVKSALRVADGAIIVVDAMAGVEVGTELVWQYCDQMNLPRSIVINRMDRENASYTSALESIQSLSSIVKLVPVQLPWGKKHGFQDVIGLLSMRAQTRQG